VKILTLNIRHGGGNRIPKLLSRITSYSADIIVLTEFRNNRCSDLIKNKLYEEGYLWQSTAISGSSRANTVFISAKIPFTTEQLVSIPHIQDRAILAKFEQFYLLGVYFAQRKEKKLLFDFIINDVVPTFAGKGVVIGDFNTGRSYIDEPGKSFYCIDSFVQLEVIGLIDSWRKRNVDKREYSWYSHAGNGFRIDHVFSTKEMDGLITYIEYDHTPRLEGETDHSALLVEFSERNS
jgi:exonuclease III